jgi:hypothetical protein
VVFCLKNCTTPMLKKIVADAPFIKRLNCCLDVGNGEQFLKQREVVFEIFSEEEEKEFDTFE